MVALLSMAMMSGRGVITSRTMVSRKSARFRSSSRACPSWTASTSGGGAGGDDFHRGGVRLAFAVGLADARMIFPDARLALAVAARAHPQHAGGERLEQAREDVERRQQEVEHALGIVADDEQRDQVLARHHDRDDGQHQHRKAGAIQPRHPRQQRRGDHRQRADQHARGDEEAPRVFEVPPQLIAAIGALGVNAQRQPHQRIECR